MEKPHTWRDVVLSDLGILILLALASILLRALSNGQYGFHRDELATLDDARYLAWGYVAYPPLTPFIARVALELFGPSLVGVRLFAALAPVSLSAGALFQSVSFDYLWWVLIAYLTIRLLKSEDPRWWLGIGAVAGLGMMTKYTIAFLIAGIVGGLVLTKTRRYLVSPWLRENAPYLWGGVALSLLIFLPNLIWQIQHNFISLEFLSSIHARDVRIGRTEGYLIEQLIVCVNPLTIPLSVAGLYHYFFQPAGKRYRLLGWMYVIPFALFLATQARSYYLAPAYPMLLAAGAVVWEHWLASLSVRKARVALGTTWGALAIGGALFGALVLPIAPVNSGLWDVTSQMHDNFSEQIGWQELVETIAGIYTALPAAEKPQAGILAGNYGEAGAINLYGPAYGLPEAISGINSYWLRGYGDPPPQTLIVVGFPSYTLERIFETCSLAGHVTNRYNVKNEETRDHPDIFVCRGLRQSWPEFWKYFQYFG
jgi:4-amino-4-deoxy-L-arabinose transferase-like glycosyltransferase